MPTYTADVMPEEVYHSKCSLIPSGNYIGSSDYIFNKLWDTALDSPLANDSDTPYSLIASYDYANTVKPVDTTDDFYYRVHVVPSVINLGNILNETIANVKVFNAFFSTEDINQITAINDEGINKIDPDGVSYPYTMTPLQELNYQFQILTSGGATINAEYTFDFASDDIVAYINGVRIVVFGYEMNWKNGLREQLRWKTTVLKPRSGYEQRFSLNSSPRQHYSFTTRDLPRNQSSELRAKMLGWHTRFFGVPVWTDSQRLSSTLAAGATSIPVTTSGYNYFVNGNVILYTSNSTFETAIISAVNGGSLDLTRATTNEWPAGTRVMPLFVGHMGNQATLTQATDAHVSMTVEFAPDTSKQETVLSGGSQDESFNSKEILVRKPNWKPTVGITSENDVTVFDNEVGINQYFENISFADQTYRYEFLLRDRAEILWFKQFIGRRVGRRDPFYMPTWMSDLTPVEPIGSSDTQLVFENNGHDDYFSSFPGVAGIQIEDRSGNNYKTLISGSSADGDELTFTVATATGTALALADVKKVSYIVLCRLATDNLQINWLSNDKARLILPVTWVAQ